MMHMRKIIVVIAVSAFCCLPAFCVEDEEDLAKVEWGEEQETEYRVWTWLAERKGHSEESWKTLRPAFQRAEVTDAVKVCGRAAKQASYADGSAGGEPLIKMTDSELVDIDKCLDDGPAVAGDLREKRARLFRIKAKAAEGRFDEEDADWMAETGLTLRLDRDRAEALTGDAAARRERQQRTHAAAGSKYSRLGGNLDRGTLSGVYDGGKTSGAAEGPAQVRITAGAGGPGPLKAEARLPQKKLSYTPPPEMELGEKFRDMEDYGDLSRESTHNKVMAEVDRDGAEAAGAGKTVRAAGYAALKSVYSVSKDFDETFINNPSPKPEDVERVVTSIRAKTKNPQEAWETALKMRNARDFPALRDAEHYLWACAEADESRWKAARTVITTPLYSAAKLPGLRSIFFDDKTSPPSFSEIKWGWKGVKDCVK